MRDFTGLRIAITGAAGFIGRAVVQRVARGTLGVPAVIRLNDVQSFEYPGAEFVRGSCADAGVRERLLGGGIDLLFHLASLPGGAAERQPALGRAVNLDGSLALLDAVAGTVARDRAPVVVYASSIAALGIAKQPVDEATALRPTGSYGTHKAMVELYLADLTRRGLLDGRSVRPAGIVARPRSAYDGFATAWMSDMFHAAYERSALAIPARDSAQVWLQSVDTVADNLIHAARMPAQGLPAHRAWTLPATVTRLDALIAALGRYSGHALRIEHGTASIDQPPLDASAALALGFVSDGDGDALVRAVLTRLAEAAPR